MKLFYYKDRRGNFGDDLNPWIWNALAPELFDDDDSTVLVGIGTLINSKAPARPRKVVFGSGVGYHRPPRIDHKWKFYCVRGPRSAQCLGLDRSMAISDPAVLLTRMPIPAPTPGAFVSYMPHHASLRHADWRGLCEKAGLRYLDPADDVAQTVARIRQSRLVIAEAMHAAIVADAFRVPWIAVSCYDHILDFKWSDWCESLGMSYRPLQLPRIWDGAHIAAQARQAGPGKRFKGYLRQGLRRAGLSRAAAPPVPNAGEVEESVVRGLAWVAEQGEARLSRDGAHQEAVTRLLESLDCLKRDCRR
ncbi:polysaccharide pyruvyl transferase family protein [Noviherbaspirillum aridicola]|uniref:Succinoglycan biosynthesis protein exov n=1 Tax=Noviherbaspirillum aridicola TaxID=2849687 RepID=A0ABQ4Q722_9BURK|nr:polysaccharide pyruvyl transferase family protein [Noviherbaspirillum aridicola]GIZ52847.1 succinoglycan biosynthesis protein exov [Noviherbaspirillum aridicola]